MELRKTNLGSVISSFTSEAWKVGQTLPALLALSCQAACIEVHSIEQQLFAKF